MDDELAAEALKVGIQQGIQQGAQQKAIENAIALLNEGDSPEKVSTSPLSFFLNL